MRDWKAELWRGPILALVLMLPGCGVVYNKSAVMPGQSAQGDVTVREITPQAVLEANGAGYSPRALPAYFVQSAGGEGLRRTGGAPAPAIDRPARPAQLATLLPPPASPGSYRIGVGDVVLLATPKTGSSVEELSGLLAAQNARQGYTVQDDGTISIPGIGRVEIAGMTIEEAEAALFRQFLDKNANPNFSVELAEFHSQKVTIGGAVADPGVIAIGLSPLYLDEALAERGGVRGSDPGYALVRIFRAGKIYQIPLVDLYKRSGAQRVRLASGDSVFVGSEYDLDKAAAYFEQQLKLGAYRESEMKMLATQVELRRAALKEKRESFAARLELGAEKRDYVYIAGELPKQSRYALPFGQTASLADALFDEAGGIFTQTADPRQIYVLRAAEVPEPQGQVTAWHLDAGNAAGLLLATRFELRPNDVVFVAAQKVTHWSNVVNAIMPRMLSASISKTAE
ncbi:MAG: polysaccharide biosynthesis/export family protein [Thioclava sp.]|nr:polysaccharide biosynthesis/export family protein [Thioclava sp.]MBD3804864.1 polysaccharide biosynthesis/export family protein [Thioclava sp.]